jgi:hypothetical protein
MPDYWLALVYPATPHIRVTSRNSVATRTAGDRGRSWYRQAPYPVTAPNTSLNHPALRKANQRLFPKNGHVW